jgi:hypothetical protein
VSEIGESAELIDELFMESVKADKAKPKSPAWYRQVALSSLVLALLTALGGLLAGVTGQEVLLKRTQEIIELSRLEGDRVSVEVMKAKHEILVSLGQARDPGEIALVRAYEEQERELGRDARREELQVQAVDHANNVLAIAVTVLSVGITLSGMAVVVEEKRLWLAGLIIGAGGVLALALGIVMTLI